jgi:hypothetical protein
MIVQEAIRHFLQLVSKPILKLLQVLLNFLRFGLCDLLRCYSKQEVGIVSGIVLHVFWERTLTPVRFLKSILLPDNLQIAFILAVL